jgi:signal transduction histidine kinase
MSTERRQDAVFAAVLALALVAFNWPDWLAATAAVAGSAALIWRRQHPITVFTLAAAGFAVSLLWHLDSGNPLLFITWIALYSVPVYATPRQEHITIATVVAAGIGVMAYLGITVEQQTEGSVVVAALLAAAYVVTAWFLGRYHRQLQREKEAVAARATAEERARIARELHDMLAHTMSGMVVLAGGARKIAETKPEAAAKALAQIEETGRKGMAETRMLLDSLRDGTAPTLADLSTLVEEVRETGLTVKISTEGDPSPVPLPVDVAAYRIVQESLTNIRRHAGPATAHVDLKYRPEALEVEIADNGKGGVDQPGHGIAGMLERATLAGGELRAGPRADGGWSVRAIFPVTP